LGVILYNIFLALFKAGIHVASLFNSKAKKWVKGRKNIFEKLAKVIPENQKIIWVHCASLGEFEQGRPLIEKLRAQNTQHKILLTFFSPSGYEVQKNYTGVDWVFYLPFDGSRNARRFLKIVKPALVIFVKYEFWYYYLKKIKYRHIPLLLISASFRRNTPFFKWYGALQRKMLSRFDHLFVQNEESKKLVSEVGFSATTSISGDTRFDRVIEIAGKFEPITLIAQFIDNKKTIVAGSTWKEDEEIISRYTIEQPKDDYKWIIAPHEINSTHLSELKKLFPDAVLFSDLGKSPANFQKNILIIDNIGMLSKLYYYATIALIGGGFSKGGVHNVLEAAVYGKPILFGPVYHEYHEAVQLIEEGGAISPCNYKEFHSTIDRIAGSTESITEMSVKSREYVLKNKGATEKILRYIQEKRLLTN
jgi:3-deoxy-D-manno-octulosonic-acid transferase